MSKLPSTLVAPVALAALLATAPATAQTQAPAPAPLSAATRAQVIDTLAAYLERAYVYADTGRMIADVLRGELHRGAYDSITYAPRFAETVTRDLRRVNHDMHLSLSFDPAVAEQVGPLPAEGLFVGRRPAAAPATPATDAAPNPFVLNARRRNFGLEKLEILPGNIGYLQVNNFLGVEGSEEAVANAVKTLANTDAIILDLRRNHGGSGAMSHLLFSHFFDSDTVSTIHFTNRSSGQDEVRHTVGNVPGPRLAKVPVYVLTSRATASAGEEFTTVLKSTGRATVVGDRTMGAGHMVASVSVGQGFVGAISLTRVTDAHTGKEWEQVGVQPDVTVDPEQALSVATAMALRAVAAKEQDAERRTMLQWLAEAQDAEGRAAKLGSAAEVLAGRYSDGSSIELRDGTLYLRRAAGMLAEPMIPLGSNTFAVGPMHLQFDAKGKSMTVQEYDGTSLSYTKAK